MEQSPKQSPAEAVLDELMDRSLLNGVDDDLHLEIVEAIVKAVLSSSDFPAPAAVEPVADLIERFERQVTVALQYAVDEKPSHEKFIASVFELQVGHFRDIGKEMSASLSQISTKLENAEREIERWQTNWDANVAEMSEKFRAVNIARVIEATGQDIIGLAARAESAEQERDELRAKLAEAEKRADTATENYNRVWNQRDAQRRRAEAAEASDDAVQALATALVAMKLASALPGVSDEYDFAPAISEAEAVMSAIRSRAVKGAGQS